MPPDLTPCPACDGSGRIPLTGVYAETLMLLRKHGKEMTGSDFARLIDIERTAACNRLARLEAMGFVKSRRYGSKRLYTAV